ncbi:restriction endonuclease [Haladaptatus caseinilyticus]|uniref:restriction endonuclease n=1 Tax=Haladaptatus caseinilyticus TaxID=2993314 RepID=UPI00224B4855|nr:restriction endonuclease [Haladaptatus caseinilyticus]
MEQSQFAEFVAALWSKQGWQTQVTTKKEKSFVTLQRDGAEGLIWARPATGEGISGEEIQQFGLLCKQYGVGEGAVVTSGNFTDDAEKIGSQAGVQLVDGEKLRTIVEARELHDLVRRYADTDVDETTDSDDAGPSLPSLPDSMHISPKVAAGIVVALLALVGATTVAPMIFETGGEVQEREWNLTARFTSPHNATDSLSIRWNAKRVSEIDPESGDSGVYKPNEGTQFLLVRMNVTNEGNDSVGLKPADFGVRSNGTVHGYQPLENVTAFSPTVIGVGQTETFWTVVSLDADASEATLIVSDRVKHGGVRIAFTRDSNLAVTL